MGSLSRHRRPAPRPLKAAWLWVDAHGHPRPNAGAVLTCALTWAALLLHSFEEVAGQKLRGV
jgi:hypothetical protein